MFDEVIRSVRDWFDSHEARQMPAGALSTMGEENNQPLTGAARSASSIILKEDTRFELGHPSIGSANAVLTTTDNSLVQGSRITIVGPDLADANTEKLPFAQVVVACCQEQIEQIPFRLDNLLYKYVQSDGYMIRSIPGLIWARVSKDAFNSGFSLSLLGTRLLHIIKQECPSISKADVYFVTSRKSDVDQLAEMMEEAKIKLRKLRTFAQAKNGEYECETALDCEKCPEQEVCDNIRDVIKIRKGDRIISLGRASE